MSTATAKTIAKSSLWVTAGFGFVRVSQLATQVLLARLLSPTDFGIWAMVLVVTTLSNLFRDWAIAGVLVYRGLDDKKLVDAVYSLGVNISLGMALLQALSGFPLAQFFGVPVLLPLTACVSLVFLLGAGAGSHGAVLQRRMQFRELAMCDSAVAFCRMAVALTCAALGLGVWSFAIAEIATALVDALLKRHLSRYHFTYQPIPDPAAVREVQSYIGGLVGINLAVYVNTNADNLVIGKLVGTSALGYYNLAYQLAMLPVFALSQVNRVSFSVLAQQSIEGKKAYVRRAVDLYTLMAAPIFGLAYVMAPWGLPLLFGARWTEAVPIFQIVLGFAYARGIMSILGTALNAINKPGVNAAINWVLVPLSISAYWLGAQLGGAVGVAISVALVMGLVATFWFWLATCRAIGCSVGLLAQPILLPTVAIGISIAVVMLLPLPQAISIWVQPFGLVVIYLGAIALLSGGKAFQSLAALLQPILSKGAGKAKAK